MAVNTTTMAPPRLWRLIDANGWFSLVSGGVLLAGAPLFDGWFDLPAWLIAVVGLGLMPYGLMLRSAARGPHHDERMAWLATIGDAAWVLMATVVLVIPNTMTAAGKWTLALLTIAVADFGVLQLRALTRRRVG